MNPIVDKAIKLAASGVTVIPLRGKIPQVEGWQQLSNITESQIMDWDKAGLWKNIGMVCGKASNGIVVIDFDGMQGYNKFCDKFPELVDTYTVETGSGFGVHCYYMPKELPASCGMLGDEYNIEIKSDGKQVVIPPSIHPDTKRTYLKKNTAQIKRLDTLAPVIEWMQSLKGVSEQWQPPKARSMTSDKLNPKLLDAVEGYFRAQKHVMHGEWINCPCPNHNAHKHGDTTPSFGYNPKSAWGNCFRCGDMPLKQICEYINYNPQDYGGFYEVITTYKNTLQSPKTAPNSDLGTPLAVKTRDSGLDSYLSRLMDIDNPIANPPVPFPITALHGLGGYARIVKAGKLVAVVGISGGGKTTVLEAMVDSWLSMNVPSLVWSPEWDADEFVERAVQRYGGANMADMYMHDLWKYELKTNPNGQRIGKPLNIEQENASIKALDMLRQWQTKVGYIDCPLMDYKRLESSLEATLNAIDFRPRVLICDYVQLLYANADDLDMTLYNMLMRFKGLCRINKLVGVVACQVTKVSTKGQSDGKLLDSQDARYINDDAFNLFLTINPDRDESGLFMPSSVLNVVKNSLGAKDKVRVATDWARLAMGVEKHPNQYFGEEK